MALDSIRIDAITDLANRLFANGLPPAAVLQAVRDSFADLVVTGCLESAMVEEPFREEPDYLLFLVDRSEHCWKITDDPERAQGVVFAQRED